MSADKLYPASEPYHQAYLDVGDGHQMFYEEFGNPDGIPVAFVHGGPGSGTAPWAHQFFDPDAFRIVLFDQRGCGKSTPHGCIDNNSPDHLVRDMEMLREHLDIAKWHVFGGSWGSTLGLLYAEEHPQRVSSLTLRGVFMMRETEVDHFITGMGGHFPEVQQRFEDFIPEEEKGAGLLEAYYQRLVDPDPAIHLPAAHAWVEHEGGCFSIKSNGTQPLEKDPDAFALGMARLEAHFFRNHMFTPDDRILKDAPKIAHIPTTIVQGRYDVICPPVSAYALSERLHQCDLSIVIAGHSARDPEIETRLLKATNAIRDFGMPFVPGGVQPVLSHAFFPQT